MKPQLARIEVQKKELLRFVEHWSPAQVSGRPPLGGWSAAEVLDHLVRTEEEILKAAKRGLSSPHRIGIRDRLGCLFIQRIFQTDRKVKVPAAATQVLPGPDEDLASIVQRWDLCRLDLTAFENSLAPEQINLGIFRHPVAGWMGLPQIVDFFSVHMTHHAFQLARLRDCFQSVREG